MITTFLSRIQQFNRYLPYLTGTRNKFDADDVVEMVNNALPMYVHTIVATSDHKWYDKNKSDSEVCVYFDCLLVISALARGKKLESKSAYKKQITYMCKKNSLKHELFSQNKTKFFQC
jgi:hypothetical protein